MFVAMPREARRFDRDWFVSYFLFGVLRQHVVVTSPETPSRLVSTEAPPGQKVPEDRQFINERENQMCKLQPWISEFVRREDGPTAVEYAVMLALIIVVCITAITALGKNANNTFLSVGNSIGAAGS